MPVDIAMDTKTGDWIFSAHGDLQDAQGEYLVVQRMIARLRIPRGRWIYDVNREIGSDILLNIGKPIDVFARELPSIIAEALEPMDEIEIINITLDQNTDDPSQIMAHISYRYRTRPEEVPITGQSDEEFTATIPVG